MLICKPSHHVANSLSFPSPIDCFTLIVRRLMIRYLSISTPQYTTGVCICVWTSTFLVSPLICEVFMNLLLFIEHSSSKNWRVSTKIVANKIAEESEIENRKCCFLQTAATTTARISISFHYNHHNARLTNNYAELNNIWFWIVHLCAAGIRLTVTEHWKKISIDDEIESSFVVRVSAVPLEFGIWIPLKIVHQM